MKRPDQARNHWSNIAETGTEAGMQLLICAYRLGGRTLFKILLLPVMLFYFALRADSRKASRQYLRKVSLQGANISAGYLASFKHFWQFGLALIDKLAVWMGNIHYDQLQLHNPQLIDDLLSADKGGVLAISHLGNFEVISAMSQQHKGVKLTVLHHTHHAEKFNRILEKYAVNRDIEFLQVTEIDIAVATLMSERVAQGEFIAIACDRVPINNSNGSVNCQFLGEPALFPKGSCILAQVLAVPLIMVLCLREQGQYHVYFEQLYDGSRISRSGREAFIQGAMQKTATLLETHAIRQPLQWFNFYDFWRR